MFHIAKASIGKSGLPFNNTVVPKEVITLYTVHCTYCTLHNANQMFCQLIFLELKKSNSILLSNVTDYRVTYILLLKCVN